MSAITTISGKSLLLSDHDIDTDRIIPGRFLTCVTFDNLGPKAFYDERFDGNGGQRAHPFNQQDPGTILVTGNNFGCGSSREHAPQALKRFGIRAIIAGSYSEIFFTNSTTIGLPCLTLATEDLDELHQALRKEGQQALEIDLKSLTLKCQNKILNLHFKESSRQAFIRGSYDSLDVLLANKAEIEQKAAYLKTHTFLPI